jgi:hypothetical protein
MRVARLGMGEVVSFVVVDGKAELALLRFTGVSARTSRLVATQDLRDVEVRARAGVNQGHVASIQQWMYQCTWHTHPLPAA